MLSQVNFGAVIATGWFTALAACVVSICMVRGLRWHVARLGADLRLPDERVKLGAGLLGFVAALLALACRTHASNPAVALPLAMLITALLVLAWIDVETMLLPDVLTIPLLWVGLLVNLDSSLTFLPDAVLGAVFGFVLPWSVTVFHNALSGGDGLGMGDMKLFSALGAWFGWMSLPGMILLAVALHLGYALIAWLCIHDRRRGFSRVPLPFGPAISTAGIVMAIFQWPVLF